MRKRRFIFIIVGVLFILIVLLFLRFGGEILVVEDDVADVEGAMLVLLMGSVGDRSLGAYELYENGTVDHILMVESYLVGRELLEEKNIHIPEDAELSKQILTELDVPEEDITVLPGDAESTKDEALAVKRYIENHPEIDTIIITTSKYHSLRSKQIFKKALKNEDVVIYSSPTPYDRFQARGWYQNREDIQRVVMEYLKLANHYLYEQFQL